MQIAQDGGGQAPSGVVMFTRFEEVQNESYPVQDGFAPDGLRRSHPGRSRSCPVRCTFNWEFPKIDVCSAPSGEPLTPDGVEIDPEGVAFAPSGAS